MYDYIANVLSSFSQVANVVLLNGNPNESISGRAYRENWNKTMWIINTCFFWQSNHCRGAYKKDLLWATEFVKG